MDIHDLSPHTQLATRLGASLVPASGDRGINVMMDCPDVRLDGENACPAQQHRCLRSSQSGQVLSLRTSTSAWKFKPIAPAISGCPTLYQYQVDSSDENKCYRGRMFIDKDIVVPTRGIALVGFAVPK